MPSSTCFPSGRYERCLMYCIIVKLSHRALDAAKELVDPPRELNQNPSPFPAENPLDNRVTPAVVYFPAG
jgi:hypothetical protein